LTSTFHAVSPPALIRASIASTRQNHHDDLHEPAPIGQNQHDDLHNALTSCFASAVPGTAIFTAGVKIAVCQIADENLDSLHDWPHGPTTAAGRGQNSHDAAHAGCPPGR
jgi:hypothetical protein